MSGHRPAPANGKDEITWGHLEAMMGQPTERPDAVTRYYQVMQRMAQPERDVIMCQMKTLAAFLPNMGVLSALELVGRLGEFIAGGQKAGRKI